MSSPSTLQPEAIAPTASHAAVTGTGVAREQTTTVTSSSREPAVQAHEAVTTVLKTLETQDQQVSAARQSVKVDFDFGGTSLAVQVELRNGTVHAHFRTDSTELRTALEQQWKSVTSTSADKAVSYAAPVFSSSNNQNSTSYQQPDSRGDRAAAFSADSGGSRQQSRQQASGEAPSFNLSSGSRSAHSTSSSGDTIAAPASRRASLPTVQHLSTFA